MNLILASQSPRRQQLMAQIGLEFSVMVTDIDETMDASLPPKDEVLRLSIEKAEAAAQSAHKDAIIVAADTIVVLNDRVLGKPRNAEEAVQMLQSLSGNTHRVMTGVTVYKHGVADSFVEETDVQFRPLSKAEIEAYVATGEPMDKAGAYGVQGTGCLFVSSLNGDYYNVMGLPLCRLCSHLRAAGVEILKTI